ncbi:xylosidase, putative [Trichophyton benhamiae CBS 112371]|uniref:Xylosidase, putative n=1 Tax=Arthroderma benhamiae (strain ATCC MYA-4681 / CBS 112371) TaxID=663331 RepID=D4AP85_ARTBC|nr:xylosidase, putative [Trichophyton benhamiae CBS 112371]EFE35096.1 xylosidase, putative [Trichophyton benhamiae CBS 112371]
MGKEGRPALLSTRSTSPSTSPSLVFLLALWTVALHFVSSAPMPNLSMKIPRVGNPVLNGWYADPEARIFNHKYYIYPTVSTVYENQTYFEAFSSPDLKTWTSLGKVLDFKDVPWSTNRAAWAPSVAFKDGSYYMYFSAGDGAGLGVARSSSPEGPFKDALGKPLISESYFGAQPIDADIFIDDDGKNYLYYGGHSHGVVVELNDDMISLKGEVKEITPKGYVEAPWMLKRKGVYYFMYSTGGKSPLGPFDGEPVKILQGDTAIGTGTGHNSVFSVKDDYYIVYHRRFPDDNERDHRATCIDRMYFTDDGRIEPVKITTEGVEARVPW